MTRYHVWRTHMPLHVIHDVWLCCAKCYLMGLVIVLCEAVFCIASWNVMWNPWAYGCWSYSTALLFHCTALLPRLLSLAWRPALGRVLVVPNFSRLRMMEATVSLGTFNIAEMFWYPSPDLCLDIIMSLSSMDNSFDLMAWFLLWHTLSTVGPYIFNIQKTSQRVDLAADS